MLEITERLSSLVFMFGNSVNAFAKSIGVDTANLNKMVKGQQSITKKTVQKIISAYPQVSEEWLLTGEGTMLKGQQPQQYNSPNATMVNGNNNVFNNHGYAQPKQLDVISAPTAPLVPIALCRKENVDVYKAMKVPELQAEQITRVNAFAEIDFYFTVCDDAMMPNFVRGDILALRHLEEDMFIVNGNPYVLDTKSHGLLLRILKERDNKYECLSLWDKDRYEAFNVPKCDVYKVYNIKGLLRTSF